MKSVGAIIIAIILLVTFLNPTLSGAELGNEIIGKEGWVFSTIKVVEVGANAVKTVGEVGKSLIIGISEIWDNIADFFGWAKDKPTQPAT